MIIGNVIFAEPNAYRLSTGEDHFVKNPQTGDDERWEIVRGNYKACGPMCGSANMLFFREYYSAYTAVDRNAGVVLLEGTRLGCWINTIAANGVLMMPDASATCTCGYPIQCTVVWYNKTQHANTP